MMMIMMMIIFGVLIFLAACLIILQVGYSYLTEAHKELRDGVSVVGKGYVTNAMRVTTHGNEDERELNTDVNYYLVSPMSCGELRAVLLYKIRNILAYLSFSRVLFTWFSKAHVPILKEDMNTIRLAISPEEYEEYDGSYFIIDFVYNPFQFKTDGFQVRAPISTTMEDDESVKLDGLLPLSSGGQATPLTTLMVPTIHEESKATEGLRQRKHEGFTHMNGMMKSSPGGGEVYKLRRRKSKRRSIRQVFSDWNDAFERVIMKGESVVESCVHYIFVVIQWTLLTIQRVGLIVLLRINTRLATRFQRFMERWTRQVHPEERSAIGDRSRHYIWVLHELKKKFIISKHRRMYIYKAIAFCLFITILINVGLFYSAMLAEFNSHVRSIHIDTKTGREIKNVIYAPQLPNGYNEDIEWFLYDARPSSSLTFSKPLTPPIMKNDYVEIETRRFGRVNISISELVDRMKQDSVIQGNRLTQPCLCAAHYGIPLNIIIVRNGLEHEDGTYSDPAAADLDTVYYEPRGVTFVSDSIRARITIDSLVVPPTIRLERDDGLSPLEADFIDKKSVRNINRNDPDRKVYVVDLSDSYTGDHVGGKGSYSPTQKRALYEQTRNMIPRKTIEDMKLSMENVGFQGEMTIAYATLAIRGLDEKGNKLAAAYIDSPYSYCVQRCLAAVDPFF